MSCDTIEHANTHVQCGPLELGGTQLTTSQILQEEHKGATAHYECHNLLQTDAEGVSIITHSHNTQVNISSTTT